MTIDELRKLYPRTPRLLSALRDLEQAEAELKKVTAEVQAECRHVIVAEFPYRAYKFIGGAEPPWRKCLSCDLEERGWGCGYKALRDVEGRWIFPLTSR